MKKIIWITFGAAIIIVNLVAWITEMATGFHIAMLFRLTLILGITLITTIFTGAFFLVSKFEEERPLTGYIDNTVEDQGHQRKAQAEAPANTSAPDETEEKEN